MQRASAFVVFLCIALIGAAPKHVLTADYWKGYAGTKNVPATQAAQWLSWAETDAFGAAEIAPLGVKTLLYTNPNRIYRGTAMDTDQDDEYAHTCSGQRAHGAYAPREVLLGNPKSPTLAANFRRTTLRYMSRAHFDAVFVDDATGAAYAQDQPCGYDLDDWLSGEAMLIRALGEPTVYNGLNDFSGRGLAREISLNSVATGGMQEECYAKLRPDHRVSDWRWIATEKTELTMAMQGKNFFCYGRDLSPADQAYDGRLYTYASFLLTYDPQTSVLWEYYKTPSGGHVMPESQLVALDPVLRYVGRVDELRTPGGAYTRSYRRCFIAGQSVGPCVAAVNPDPDAPHDANLHGYTRTLTLNGSGTFDGGTVRVDNRPPPSVLGPLQAVIAFK